MLKDEQDRLFGALRGKEEVRASKIRWLKGFEQFKTKNLACIEAGITRNQLNSYIKDDQVFRDAVLDVKEDQNDAIQAEVIDRALNGIKKPVIFKGEITDWWYDKEASNRILELAAKGVMPTIYKDRLFDSADSKSLIIELTHQLQRLGIKNSIQLEQVIDAEVNVSESLTTPLLVEGEKAPDDTGTPDIEGAPNP
jgi:hypothetical protein